MTLRITSPPVGVDVESKACARLTSVRRRLDTLSNPIPIRCIGLAAALVVSALLFAGAFALGSILWDEQAEIAEIEQLVERIAAESAAVTNQYFAIAETSVDLAAGVFANQIGTEDAEPQSLADALAKIATSQPNVAAAYVGYPDGRFVLARSSFDVDDEVVLKRVNVAPRHETTETTLRSDDLSQVEVVNLVDDDYDPRSRPWFTAVGDSVLTPDKLARGNRAGPALIEGKSSWSDPYEFFSSNRQGITYSRAFYNTTGELEGVIGIDIELADLTAFLDERRPSVNSQAVVSNEDGTQIGRSSGAADAEPAQSQSLAVAQQSVTRSQTWSLTVRASHDDFLTSFREQRTRYEAATAAIAAILSVFLMSGSVAFTNHLSRLRVQATTDPLTGLLNRSAIIDNLETSLERYGDSGIIGLMIVDLDAFKVVNDTFGHSVGDAVLTKIATRVESLDDACASVARLGGDEFCVVYVDHATSGADNFRAYARRLMRSVFEHPLVPDNSTQSDGSGGFTMATPGSQKTPVEMFTEADIALYVAKDCSTKRTLVEYEPAMEIPAIRDALRKQELSAAFDDGQFSWHFQPEVDLATDCVVGAEALLRWSQPAGGQLEAEQFIEDVERLGLLPTLLPAMVDAMVEFLHPCRDLPFVMRLNLAQEQLADPSVPELLGDAVQRCPATTFCIEITERAFLEADDEIAESLEQLRQLGIRISLDDFGTGFSSLKELHKLPVDGIKIDKAFVAALANEDPRNSIVAMMIDLGTLMGLEVVAEGVETRTQATALKELGCKRAQGYLYGAARSASNFWTMTEVGEPMIALTGEHAETRFGQG